MSDWEGYAVRLRERFDYVNTFYHQEPRLDICDIEPRLEGRYDFVITSEVFEHVPPPVSTAFVNLRRLLSPGGVAVVTVPYGLQDETVEHFPDLHDYELVTEEGRTVLRSVTRSGEVRIFHDLVFHGGPGETLEMRRFSERGLVSEFERAGFVDVHIHRDGNPVYGIGWPEPWSLPITARAPAR
ncbi:MAG: methyltransferase domain-containing protein [Thermoleophilia bacterium]|nr:methyltransferase domain-containing protein [Thermoleophilia bacterium]